MSLISVNNLTFGYDGSYNNIFEDVSFDIDTDWRNFNLLSGGEQIKILLISLFLKGNNFLLIDEPTNHLDIETRNNLVSYLEKKKGFIAVYHDRNFLDKVVNHIIAINNTNIEIKQGNFSTWKENKDRQDNFEIVQNEKLQKDVNRLEIASKNSAKWSNEAEKGKSKKYNSETTIDKEYIGHKASKMMKKSKVMEQRTKKAIDESIFKAMLIKIGLSKSDFDTNIQDMSEGQKKKVLIAKSISEQANIYIWDELLNYIDILTRIQIKDTILNCKPTLIFVEHDETFIEKVATKIIKLER